MVLLVVDTQRLITNGNLFQFELFEFRVKELIAACRNNNVEVIFVRHDDGAGCELSKGNEGFEIYEGFSPAQGEMIFDKFVNSPFRNTGLLQYLNEKNEDTVMIVGLQTEYCIDAAVKAGFEHGFRMIVPEYTNSTFDNSFMSGEESYDYYNHFIWDKRYARCVSFEEALDMISK